MRTLRFRSFAVTASLIGGLSLFASGCGDDDDDAPAPAPTATLRVVHASANAPAVDIYANGGTTPVWQNVSYASATNFTTLTPGTYTFELRAAGTAATAQPAYTSPSVTVTANSRITAIALGNFDSLSTAPAPTDVFRIQVYVENFGAAGAGVLVRVIHGSPDAPTVAIDVGNDATSAGQAEITGLQQFAATPEAGTALPAGQALALGVWTEGVGSAKVAQFTTPTLTAGSNLFLIAAGNVQAQGNPLRLDDPGAFSILAVGPTGYIGTIGQDPQIYALHASPDAGVVDICAGTTKLGDDVNFGNLLGPVTVQPGTVSLNFFPGATAGCPTTGGTLATSPTLLSGRVYVVAAAGETTPEGNEAAFTLIATPVNQVAVATKAVVSVLHASGDAGTVFIGTLNGSNVTSPAQFGVLQFGAFSPGVELDQNTYNLGVATTNGGASVGNFNNVALTNGTEIVAVAAGAFAPDAGEEPLQLLVVDTRNWTAPSSIAVTPP